MSALPQGTVTFLFTDIEGSTELLKRLGPRYHEVLDAHARLLREAASSHGGQEVDNQGDSFFFAFARANAAVGAAVVAQRALAAHEWPDGVEVRVRMGLHTGEPSVGGERYVGLGVHRAARIGAAGHGGQVLLSNPTRELVEEELDGVIVRDIGLYKLKDIDRPEHLFQLDIGGLPSSFPPLKAAKVETGRHFSRRPVVIGALAGVIAAAVAIPVFAFGGSNGGAGAALDAAEDNSLAIIGPGSDRLVADPTVGGTPTAVASGEDAYWVANADGGSVTRIDPTTNKVVDTIANVGSGPSGIAIGNGFVWVTNSLDGTVAKIDPNTNTVVETITVGNGPVGIVYAAGAVWVANTADDTITRIDPSHDTASRRPLQIAATELAFGDGTLWATQRAAGQVVRIDPKSGSLSGAPIRVGNGPTGVAFGNGAAWVANSLDGTVSRINPGTNAIGAVIATGDTPIGVAIDARGGVWVANRYGGTLRRIDPATNLPGKPIDVGNQPEGIATAGSQLLVSVAARPGVAHLGGTLKIGMNFGPDAIDTAAAYSTASWPFLRLTNDGLVAFDHASGVAGDQPVPDLAVSLPAPTDGGRTYTFRLRRNLRYSTGKPVLASDVRASFQRYFRNGSLPVAFYDGIVGAVACRKRPSGCSLSKGIVTDNRTRIVTFHLVTADPEFLYRLAVPSASVLPAGTPTKLPPNKPVPATGPYVISAYRPNQHITLTRNRHFHEWSRAAQPDGYPDRIEIEIKTKLTADDEIENATAGRVDLVSTLWTNSPSASQLQETMSQHASQIHANPLPQTTALFLNTRLAPFNRVDVRRALNYAIDRSAYVQQSGGPALGAPTCQILPPGLPGYRPYCPYTAGATSGSWVAPDLTRARALVARSGTRGMKVKVWLDNYTEGIGPPVVKMLRSLGYRPSVKVVHNGKNFIYFGVVGDSRNKAQIGFFGWTADYPAPSDFFLQLFTCDSFRPKSPLNGNYPEFCDPAFDRKINAALAQEVVNPQLADRLWEGIDRELTDQAPMIPLVNGKVVDVVSKRVGNYQYSANGFGVLIDQLWVR